MAERWIQEADKEMDLKGTKGSFGKATSKKIARAKRKGGKEKKRAVFAANMKKIAARRRGKRRA